MDPKRPLKERSPSFVSLGIEILAGFLLSMCLVWQLGKFLSLPTALRIILGAVLSGIVTFWTIYKLVKKT